MDHLKEFLVTKDSSAPVTYGFEMKPRSDMGNVPYLSGSAGYAISKEALKRIGQHLTENPNFCQNTANEDLDVAICFNKVGVKPEKSIDDEGRERFHPFDPKTHISATFSDWWKNEVANRVPNVRFIFIHLFIYILNFILFFFLIKIFKKDSCCSESLISFHGMTRDQMSKLYQVIKEYELKAERDLDNKLLYALNYYTSLKFDFVESAN